MLYVVGHELPQAGIGDEVSARPEEAEQAAERVQREDLGAPYLAPDHGQLVGGLRGLRAGGDDAPLLARRGRDDQVRLDVALIEGAQHADLDRAEAGATGENEGDGRGLPGHGP